MVKPAHFSGKEHINRGMMSKYGIGLVCLLVLMAEDAAARSYPEGHDFWKGSPGSWTARGFFGFGFANAVWVGAAILLLLVRKRVHRRPIMAFCTALCITLVAWLHWGSMSNFSDGDKPTWIGARWGVRLQPVIAIALWIWFARLMKRPARQEGKRGFPVLWRAPR